MAVDAGRNAATPPRRPVARLLALPIVAYRRWVSPGLPARCRFYPSCSAYALEALAVHGAVRGTALTVWRLLRCQPFHPGGYDPVPARSRGPRRARGGDGAERPTSPAALVDRRGTPTPGDDTSYPPNDAPGAATWIRS